MAPAPILSPVISASRGRIIFFSFCMASSGDRFLRNFCLRNKTAAHAGGLPTFWVTLPFETCRKYRHELAETGRLNGGFLWRKEAKKNTRTNRRGKRNISPKATRSAAFL